MPQLRVANDTKGGAGALRTLKERATERAFHLQQLRHYFRPSVIVDKKFLNLLELSSSGSNSAVECQLPKLDVAGSIPVSRSWV